MKYSYDFKKECLQIYRSGNWPDTPNGVRVKNFHDMVRTWTKLEDIHGPDVLKHGSAIKWTPENIINRDFKVQKPLEKWTTDISQFNFTWGKCYFSPILDMYSNEIISYNLSLSPNLNQISNMLSEAFKKFSLVDNLIMHSDQGWQYQHSYYVNELKNHKIIQSMSMKGSCYDNSIMETFFGRLKNEIY